MFIKGKKSSEIKVNLLKSPPPLTRKLEVKQPFFPSSPPILKRLVTEIEIPAPRENLITFHINPELVICCNNVKGCFASFRQINSDFVDYEHELRCPVSLEELKNTLPRTSPIVFESS